MIPRPGEQADETPLPMKSRYRIRIQQKGRVLWEWSLKRKDGSYITSGVTRSEQSARQDAEDAAKRDAASYAYTYEVPWD